jgi:hypothetical protein
MITFIKRTESDPQAPAWHARFLAMLPAIRRTAQISFRKIRPELRGELIQEVIANCWVAYTRLAQLARIIHDPRPFVLSATQRCRFGVGGRSGDEGPPFPQGSLVLGGDECRG